jgi:ABC-type Fe3+ transport system substrate-binding protein
VKTRREFLAISAGAGALALLAACGQAAQPAASSSSAGTASKPASAAAGQAAASAGASEALSIDPDHPAKPKVATLEEELALPQTVLDAAKTEGAFSFISSINKDVARVTLDGFKKRYPFLDPQYQEASEEVRTVRTLTEYKAGKNKVDVAMGIGGFMEEYRKADALTALKDLPAYANYDVPFRDSQDLWAGVRAQLWSVGYNTSKVKAAELPKTWDEFTTAQWKGRIGVGDRPQLWILQLWKTWGAERTTDFLKKFFANDPQRRKEGLDASAKLLGAGEYDVYVPAAPYRIEGLVHDGTPVGWHTPDPLPVAFSDITILAKSPHPNAAKVFVNWFLSREGQAVYSKADYAVPVHPALRSDKQYLGMFADAFLGKPWAVENSDDEAKFMPDIRKVWQPLWVGA